MLPSFFSNKPDVKFVIFPFAYRIFCLLLENDGMSRAENDDMRYGKETSIQYLYCII